jgi:hypothetical protein
MAEMIVITNDTLNVTKNDLMEDTKLTTMFVFDNEERATTKLLDIVADYVKDNRYFETTQNDVLTLAKAVGVEDREQAEALYEAVVGVKIDGEKLLVGFKFDKLYNPDDDETTHGAKKKDQNAPAKPHDLETNPYSDESVAYRKYYSMDLPKPADFDVNPYSDEAIVYARFYDLGIKKPDDFDTNPYTDQSVAYRKYHFMQLPKPEDTTSPTFEHDNIVWHHYYGIGMPSPAEPPEEEPTVTHEEAPVEKEPDTVAPTDHL